jgi:hypothetical protein
MSSALVNHDNGEPRDGHCKWTHCGEQHLHPITGQPPDYHFLRNGIHEPRWKNPYKHGTDPMLWWYRPTEIARTCGVSMSTVRQWLSAGKLKYSQPSGPGRNHVILVQGKDLEDFLKVAGRAYQRKDAGT